MHYVEKFSDLAPGTKNQRMRLRRLIPHHVEKTAARHFEPAPIAIHVM